MTTYCLNTTTQFPTAQENQCRVGVMRHISLLVANLKMHPRTQAVAEGVMTYFVYVTEVRSVLCIVS